MPVVYRDPADDEIIALAVSALAREQHDRGASVGCTSVDLVEPDGTAHVATTFTFIDRQHLVQVVLDLLEAETKRLGARPSDEIRYVHAGMPRA